MARSQQSFAKRQKEIERQKRKQAKAERKKERTEGGKSTFENMIAYVDEFGRITSTPPEERTAEEAAEGDKPDADKSEGAAKQKGGG